MAPPSFKAGIFYFRGENFPQDKRLLRLCAVLLFFSSLLLVQGKPLWAADNSFKDSSSKEELHDSSKRYAKEQRSEIQQSKKEGASFLPVPVYFFDPDYRHIAAITAIYTENGVKDETYFCCAPYKFALLGVVAYSSSQAFFSTLIADIPFVNSLPYRLRSSINYNVNKFENYFGYGKTNFQKLTAPDGQMFSSFAKYNDALRAVDNDATSARYYQYYLRRFLYSLGVERNLDKHWRLPLLFNVENAQARDYSQATIRYDLQGQEVEATQLDTKLYQDYIGTDLPPNQKMWQGGWSNSIKVGAIFDKRDFEPDPASGYLGELIAELSYPFVGSSFAYQRVSSNFRNYFSLSDSIVLAQRLMLSYEWGEVPLYNRGTISFSDKNISALGGRDTLRGYRSRRFNDQGVWVLNLEMRHAFFKKQFEQNHIGFSYVLFADMAMAFAEVKQLTRQKLLYSGGVGLRFALNLSNVISLDLGLSPEGMELYLGAGHQF